MPGEAFIAESVERARTGRRLTRRDDPRLTGIWKQEAAADARNWREELGDEAFRAFVKDIRLEPFVIQRR